MDPRNLPDGSIMFQGSSATVTVHFQSRQLTVGLSERADLGKEVLPFEKVIRLVVQEAERDGGRLSITLKDQRVIEVGLVEPLGRARRLAWALGNAFGCTVDALGTAPARPDQIHQLKETLAEVSTEWAESDLLPTTPEFSTPFSGL